MTATKLTVDQFVQTAIETLGKPGYSGIHVVYSGFNSAFRAYFGTDPREALKGNPRWTVKPCKGGAYLFPTGSVRNAAPKATENSTLVKMGLQPIGKLVRK